MSYFLMFMSIGTEVTHTIWWHYLTVIIPDDIKYSDVGCLYVTGDSNDDA